MAFWSANFGEGTQSDPKRKFRFKVEITNLAGASSGTGATADTMLWWAKTVSKPSFTIAAAEHKYLNHVFYYPGTVTWNEVVLTMVDPGSPDMAQVFTKLIVNAQYNPPADSTDLATMTKATAVSALGDVNITQIDGDGVEVEAWTLYNAFITDVKYGDLAYGDDELTELSVTFKYDWATLASGTDTIPDVEAVP
tara:strand:+ start:645 stop:1229 length:585 start_codon:yes stop_codon:yes gene_type:complete